MADNQNSLFLPGNTSIETAPDQLLLKICGQKNGRPSKRILLPYKKLKIHHAQITRRSNRGDIEIEVKRINHLPSLGQARLHTDMLMPPGKYELKIYYKPELGALEKLKTLFESKP